MAKSRRLTVATVTIASRSHTAITEASVVLVPAIGQGVQDVGVNDDHEVSRLPAEALGKQLIGSLGYIGPATVTDPDDRRQRARVPAIREFAGKRLKQPQGA